MKSRRDTGLILLLLLLVLVLAAAFRFYNLGSQSLWSDEGNSVALAGRSFAQIARDAANDIHPPLYYFLLRAWTLIFGTSEAALRSLSATLGVLLVLTIAELGRRLYNRITGLAAGFIAAFSPFQVYYSQEARMYMLLALEAALAMLLFWWFVSQEDRQLPEDASVAAGRRLRWLPFSGQLLILTWAAGLYTHYAFPVSIALASVLYVAWLAASRRRGLVQHRVLRWGLLLLLALGLYALWAPVAWRQLTSWPGVQNLPGLSEQLTLLLGTLAFGPVIQRAPAAPWVWVLPALAVIGALPWPLLDRRDEAGSPRMDWLRYVTPVAWVLAPIAMIVALGLFREAYLKFLLIASPPFVLLIARAALGPAAWLLARAPADAENGAGRMWWRGLLSTIWVLAVIVTIGALSGAMLARYYTDPTVARDDYRGISQFVIATGQPNDAILLTAPGQAEVFDYYYKDGLPIYALPRQRPLDPADTQAELNKLLDYTKIYAVYWATEEADPDGLIQNWLNSRGYKTLDQWHGNVRLAVYVMPEKRAPDEVVEQVNAQFGPDIVLDGYRSWNLAPTAGEVTQLQLNWRAVNTPQGRYKVFLQLLDARDQIIAQRDAEPAGEGKPTNTWTPGETVVDNHGLLIPPGTPPGTYRRILGLYDAETMERLKLPDGSDYLSLAPITVTRNRTAPPLEALGMQHPQQFDFGAISLLGHDQYKRGFRHAPDTPIYPNDLLHLTFYWRANVAPRADWWFDLALSDSTGKTVAALQAPLVSDTYLTTLWQEGEVVRGEHDLLIPPDLPPDTYRLSLTMLPDADTQAGIAYLGTVTVAAPAAQEVQP
jgi:mannosyltransferase